MAERALLGLGNSAGAGAPVIFCSSTGGQGGSSGNAESGPGSLQDKKLSPAEIRKLERETGATAHQIKSEALGTNRNIAQYDLYKDSEGNVLVKAKGGSGEAIPTGLKIKWP